MGARGAMMGSVGKAAQGAKNQTSSTQAISMLTGRKPTLTNKQIRKRERKAAHRAAHQNTPADAMPAEEAPANNFEEELKKRRKNPLGGSAGGDGTYGGNTNLG